MEELETVLVRRAESLGVEIKRGLAITGFHQTEDGVTIQAGDQSFKSKWLVGCDGSRSVVRKWAVLSLPVPSRNLPATLPRLILPIPKT
jgi:2-polyprenyl-6-methoxyphenol hydroxylase-like FAD-dependent oxidoreductase